MKIITVSQTLMTRIMAILCFIGPVSVLPAGALLVSGIDDAFGFMTEIEEDWESPHITGNSATVAGPWVPHSGGYPSATIVDNRNSSGQQGALRASGGNPAVAIAFLSQGYEPYGIGDSVHVEYWAKYTADFLVNGWSENALKQGFNNPLAIWQIGGSGDTAVRYLDCVGPGCPGADAGYFDTGLDVIAGRWQFWEIDFNFHASNPLLSSWDLTIDGVTAAGLPDLIGHPLNTSGTTIRAVEFGNYGADGTAFFLDNIPEPGTGGLLGLGLLAMSAGHVLRRR